MGRVMMMQYSKMKGRKDNNGERERDRDEDLTLFRELRKRQNERISSLLHCANSEDYEYDTNGGASASGKFSLFRIPSGKKEHGLESLVETNKNDYDWLKTPPATPLFPSLEMEPTAQLVVQKEIPISQPISRFAGSDLEASETKAIDGKAKHTNSTKEKLPMRSITPSHNRQRPRITKNTNEQQQVTYPATITTNKRSSTKIEHVAASKTKSTTQKQSNNTDFLALNLKKSMEANESLRKPKTRSISPSMRSRVASYNMAELLSNETPPNLRTNQRPSSTTRGRSTIRASTVAGSQNPYPTPKACISSRSPSPSVSNGGWNQLDRTKNLRSQKERFTLAAGTNESSPRFFGSKMVEKVVNARKPGINQAERETKQKPLKYREKMRQEQGYSSIDQLNVFADLHIEKYRRMAMK